MEKNKFLILLENIAKIAKQDGWIPTYNKTLDYFSWTKPVLSEDSRLVKISHDAFLYFNKDGAVEGLDVEYLTANFIEHHPSYKDFPKLFTEKADGDVFTVPKMERQDTEDMLQNFAQEIKTNICEDAFESNRGVEELQNLVDTALKY